MITLTAEVLLHYMFDRRRCYYRYDYDIKIVRTVVGVVCILY